MSRTFLNVSPMCIILSIKSQFASWDVINGFIYIKNLWLSVHQFVCILYFVSESISIQCKYEKSMTLYIYNVLCKQKYSLWICVVLSDPV